ncbi:hypothetical protein D3C71_1010140 [compost metagenome]
MVEASAEMALWALSSEPLDGRRPSTDKLPPSEVFKKLSAFSVTTAGGVVASIGSMIGLAVATCEDMAEVRHTVVHGRPTAPQGGLPELQRNPSWFGEQRSRPASTLALSPSDLDRSAEIASTLFMALSRIAMLNPLDSDTIAFLLILAPDLALCATDAARLRASL